MYYFTITLLFTLTTYGEGKHHYIKIHEMTKCMCAGNTEAGPGYVTCSETDPAAALPNNKKIEVISDRKDFVQI